MLHIRHRISHSASPRWSFTSYPQGAVLVGPSAQNTSSPAMYMLAISLLDLSLNVSLLSVISRRISVITPKPNFELPQTLFCCKSLHSIFTW